MTVSKKRITAWLLFFTMLLTNIFSEPSRIYADETNNEIIEISESTESTEPETPETGGTDEAGFNEEKAPNENEEEPGGQSSENSEGQNSIEEPEQENEAEENNDEFDEEKEVLDEEDVELKDKKEQAKDKLILENEFPAFDPDMIDLFLRSDQLYLQAGERTSIIMDLSFSTLDAESPVFEGMEFRVNLPVGACYESTQDFTAFDVSYSEAGNYVSFTALQNFSDGSLISLPFQVYYPAGTTPNQTATFTMDIFDSRGQNLNHYYPSMPSCTLEISSEHGWKTVSSISSGSLIYAEQPEADPLIPVQSTIAIKFQADNAKWMESGSSVGLLHTEKINMVGKIYVPSFVTLDLDAIRFSGADIDWTHAFLKPAETVVVNPYKLNTSALTNIDMVYQIYEVYSNPSTPGFTMDNTAVETQDISNFTYTVTIPNYTIDTTNAPTVANNTYAYTALIYADNEITYQPYNSTDYEGPVSSGTAQSLTRVYNQRHFIQYPETIKPSLNISTSSSISSSRPFNAQDTDTEFYFGLSGFSNPFTEKVANSTNRTYYYPENLYNFILTNSHGTTEVDYAGKNLWDYAAVTAVSTGIYEITNRNNYGHLTFDIEYQTDYDSWHLLGTYAAFAQNGSTVNRRTDQKINLQDELFLGNPAKITGIRYVYADDTEGLPPGFSVYTAPKLYFKMDNGAAGQIPFNDNGIFEAYNKTTLSYNRPKLDHSGKEIIIQGKPELLAETVLKSFSNFPLSHRDFLYITRNKTVKNLSGNQDQNNIYTEGDEIEYTLKITNNTESKRDMTLTDFTIIDYADSKLVKAFDPSLPYTVKLSGQDITGLTALSVEQGPKDRGKDIHPVLTFAFSGATGLVLPPGKDLTITYTVTIPDLAIPSGSVQLENEFFYYYDDTHIHTQPGYCADCGIKNEGSGNSTITVWKNVPGIGIRKQFSMGNQSVISVNDTVHVVVEARHFGDQFDRGGNNMYAVIMDTLSSTGFNFDAAGNQVFDETLEVHSNGKLIPKDKYSVRKVNFTNNSSTPYFSVSIPAEYFDSGSTITLSYSLKAGKEGAGYGEVNFGSSLYKSYNHTARLAIYDNSTGKFLNDNAFFTDLGNWGTSRASSGLYFSIAGRNINLTGANVYASSTINITKEAAKLGLMHTQANVSTDQEAGRYTIGYDVKVENFNTSYTYSIPAGAAYIIDILPEGQNITGQPTLVRYNANGAPYSTNYPAAIEELGETEGRKIVKIYYTINRAIPLSPGESIVFSFQAAGDLSIFQSANVRLQNWVAFKPDVPCVLTEALGYGYIDSINVSNPYLYPATNDTNKLFYLKNFCEIDLEHLLVKPSLSVNLLKHDSDNIYSSGDKMDIYPGTNVSWRLKVDNMASASAGLYNFKIVAVLPGGFEFNKNSTKIWNNSLKSWEALELYGSIDSVATKADGRQYIIWTITETVDPGNVCLIKFDTGIPLDYYGSDFTYAYLIPNPNQSWWEESIQSGAYLDEQKSLDRFGEAVRAIGAFANISVYGAFAIQSQISVTSKDEKDTGLSSLNTLRAGFNEKITYSIKIESSGEYSFQDLVLMNVLPHPGDTGVKLTKQPRNSEWAFHNIENVQVYLNGAPLQEPSFEPPRLFTPIIASAAAPTAEIRFSDKQTVAANDWHAGSADSSWYQTPTENTKSMRVFIAGTALSPQDKIEIVYDLTTPGGSNFESGTAWNSFAFETLPYKAGASEASRLRAEPSKTGVELITGAILLKKSIKNPSPQDQSAIFQFNIESLVQPQKPFTVNIKGSGTETLAVAPGTYKISELATEGYTLVGFNHSSSNYALVTVAADETTTVSILNEKTGEVVINPPDGGDGDGDGGNTGGNEDNNSGGNGGGFTSVPPASGSISELPDIPADTEEQLLLLDDYGIPLGSVELMDENQYINIDPENIPLGNASTGKENPKTGDYQKPSYWIMATSLCYIICSYILAITTKQMKKRNKQRQ